MLLFLFLICLIFVSLPIAFCSLLCPFSMIRPPTDCNLRRPHCPLPVLVLVPHCPPSLIPLHSVS